jgi:hypothetical protein
MIELWSKYIEIQIQHAHRARDIVHILVDLVLVLYTDYVTDEPTLYRREYIVPDVAREIGKIPSILLICYCFL